MFSLDVLPARHGDALWLVYGDNNDKRYVLIDAGTVGTAKDVKKYLNRLTDDEVVELAVVTHIDADHIGGMLRLFEDDNLAPKFKDVWFNAWKHLLPEFIEEEGPVQGEKLFCILNKPQWNWNLQFGGKRVASPQDGALTVCHLDGGLKLTILSPRPTELYALQKVWQKVVEKAGMAPGIDPEERIEEELPEGVERFGPDLPDIDSLAAVESDDDASKANGSSIGLLAEFQGRRILLSGDAHPDVLMDSLRRLPQDYFTNGRIKLDLFKLPHHGSRANINKALLDMLDCQHFVFSTSGAYFRHPDREAVAKVIKFSKGNPTLWFNYRSNYTKVWAQEELTMQYNYSARYPKKDKQPLHIKFSE